MGVLSFQFLLLATIVALGHRLLPWARARTLVFTLANLVFLGSFANDPLALLPIVAFLTFTWLGIVWLRKRPGRLLLVGWLVASIGCFVVMKQYAFVQPLFAFSEPLLTVGLSYVLFRVLHLMIDLGTGGRVEGLSALRFFNYTSSFLTFVSGPIQRFEDHVRELEADPRARPPLDGGGLLFAGSRAIVGLVKLLLAAPTALHLQGWASAALAGAASPMAKSPAAVMLSVATLSYLMFLYWNFSGYMDLVIAAGKLIGFELPENFDRPFSSPNFIELWSRWHITLSDWFRFYVFNPMVTALTRFRSGARLVPYYGVFGFLLTFFVMGVWHGTTAIFVFYGLLLGSAMAVNKLYQVQLRLWLGKQRSKRLAGNVVYERVCNGLCIGFFALALACFWLDWHDLARLSRRLGLLDVLGALALSAAVTIVVRLLYDLARLLTSPAIFRKLFASVGWRQAWTSFALFILLIYAALSHSNLPPFVYAEF